MKTLELNFLKEAMEKPNLIKQDKAWLDHIKPYLAAIKPTFIKDGWNNYSAEDFFVSLGTRDKREVVTLADGRKATIEQLQLIWKILGTTSRSDILASSMSQIEFPQYSAAVPIGMLALKETYGIKYSQWDLHSKHPKSDVFNAMLLGKSLANIPQVRQHLNSIHPNAMYEEEDEQAEDHHPDDAGYDCFDPQQQLLWRKQILRDGMVKSTEYAKLAKLFPNIHPLGYHTVPKIYWCMLTQTWIFDPSIRIPSMITDIEDFDTLPKPLEEINLATNGLPW